MRLLPFDYAARNAGRNPVRSILMAAGAGAVVFLVILMGAFVQSMAATMRSTGEPLNVMIVGLGSEDFVEQSEISPAVPSIAVAAIDSIATLHGKPLISPEIMHSAIIAIPGREVQDDTHKILVRGITDTAFLVHPQVSITEGRAPGPGEIIVGALAPTRLNVPPEDLDIGKTVTFENQQWTISGKFTAPGTAFDAEIWAPIDELLIQTKRTTYSSAVVRLKSDKGFSDVDFFTKQRLDLELAAVRETTYYEGLAKFFRPVQIMGWVMAGLIVVSGLFGGLNVMMAAIASRTKELACLETLGFGKIAITVALLQESLLQAGTGTLLSLIMAHHLLHGSAIRFTMGAVELAITPDVLAAGMAAGLTLALVGTLIPALRFARRPLIDQLR